MTRSLIALVTFAAMAAPVLAQTATPVAAPTQAASAPVAPPTQPAPASSPTDPKADTGKKENKLPKLEPKPQGEAK